MTFRYEQFEENETNYTCVRTLEEKSSFKVDQSVVSEDRQSSLSLSLSLLVSSLITRDPKSLAAVGWWRSGRNAGQ